MQVTSKSEKESTNIGGETIEGSPKTRQVNTQGLSALTLKIIKDWIDSLVFPPRVSLGAVVLAAFLIYPAYRGLVSGRRIYESKAR